MEDERRYPWERLHPGDMAELRRMMVDAVRQEVEKQLDEAGVTKDGGAKVSEGPGKYCHCADGWLRCMYCDGGALPTWEAGVGWKQCPHCKDSGKDGYLPCSRCRPIEC